MSTPTSTTTPISPEQLVIQLDPVTTDRYAARAMDALTDDQPELSAHQTFSRGQKGFAALVLAVLVGAALLAGPLAVGRLVIGLLSLLYGAAVSYRLLCLRHGLRQEGIHRVSDAAALAVAEQDLPRYTVLVPAYREPTVIAGILEHLDRLDYPRSRLEVLVLLEADDDETLAAVRAAGPGDYVRVLVVPLAAVTTKPRACNYGLQLADGDLVTIYDAEDRPEPLQLRRSAVVLAAQPREMAGLQARLGYFNTERNLLTRWFTSEYASWFEHYLPGLVSLGAPVPLGGTSNHLRTDVLREVGGWDPYHVTEDADLGLRLARGGYRIGVLDSLTLEEANSDPINWIKQRSRWYKGYLQTWLVHMRDPRRAHRELGWRGLAGVNLFIGGTPLLSMLNPLFWGLALVWFLAEPHVIEQLFSGPVGYVAVACWLLGNFAMIYSGLVSLHESARTELLL